MALIRECREKLEKFFLRVVVQKERPAADDNLAVKLLLWHLKQLSHVYGAVVQARLLLYEKGIIRYHTLGCQVISIGNLTVGGTGKTPVVEIFARRLQQAGRHVAILSRGYKKKEPTFREKMSSLFKGGGEALRVVSDGKKLLLDSAMGGDEPYMLASHLPEVTVLVNSDRVTSGRYAINRQSRDTLLLDDGFQYLSLKHRVDIVLVDRLNPFGNGYVLPRGILREPIKNIRRATVIFITKCEHAGSSEELKARLRSLNPKAEIIECSHRAQYLQNVFTRERKPLEFLKDKPVTALSGIAAPDGFEQTIERLGAKVLCRERFADHHRYSQQELIDMINRSAQLQVSAIITTEKDAVRFPRVERADVDVYFMRVDIELLSGTETFDECISRICFEQAGNGK